MVDIEGLLCSVPSDFDVVDELNTELDAVLEELEVPVPISCLSRSPSHVEVITNSSNSSCDLVHERDSAQLTAMLCQTMMTLGREAQEPIHPQQGLARYLWLQSTQR